MSRENADSGLENESFRSSSEGYDSSSEPEEVSFQNGLAQARAAREEVSAAIRGQQKKQKEQRKQWEERLQDQREEKKRRLQELQGKRLPDEILNKVAPVAGDPGGSASNKMEKKSEDGEGEDEDEDSDGEDMSEPPLPKIPKRFAVMTPDDITKTSQSRMEKCKALKESHFFRPELHRVSGTKAKAIQAKRKASGKNVFASAR